MAELKLKRVAPELIQDITDDLREWQTKITSQLTNQPDGVRRKAIITGGSTGIGRGMALIFAQHGYDVAITYKSSKEEADAVGAFIRDVYGRACHVIKADSGNETEIRAAMRKAIKLLGDVDLLVNNAGLTILDEKGKDRQSTIDTLIDVNFKGYLYGMFEVVDHMRKKKHGGCVLNISSIHGQEVYPDDALYGGMKAALDRAMQTYALQYAEFGIRVNNIAPGWIMIDRTGDPTSEDKGARLIPLRRAGRPQDIAATALFLASEAASYITGQTLLVDGGKALAGVNVQQPVDR